MLCESMLLVIFLTGFCSVLGKLCFPVCAELFVEFLKYNTKQTVAIVTSIQNWKVSLYECGTQQAFVVNTVMCFTYNSLYGFSASIKCITNKQKATAVLTYTSVQKVQCQQFLCRARGLRRLLFI